MTDALTIGGSTAAASCGLDPWKSRAELWLELTQRIEPDERASERLREAARWGSLLEPVIASEVESRGYAVLPAPADPFVDGLMHAHLDGFVSVLTEGERGLPGRDGFSTRGPDPSSGSPSVSTRGVLEVKTASAYRSREWGDDENPDVPIAVFCQVQHYLEVTKLEWGLIAALLGGQRLILRPVQRDEAWGAALRAKEAEFLALVESDMPPAPDGSESADEMLRLLYPQSEPGKLVELTSADYETVQEIATRRRAVKEAEAQLSEQEQTLKARLGDGETGIFQGRKVCTYGTVRSNRLDGARLKEERPEIAAEFAKESVYRTLRITGV